MREAELLNALAQAKPGIQVTITKRMVTVATLYDPTVKGVGPTLMSAAKDCAYWLLDVVKDYPEYRGRLDDVLKALIDYDNHSEVLQL